MSHKVDQKISHTKLHNHLTSGKPLNVKGFSHVVCVRKDSANSWLAKGYEIIQDSADAVLVGKKKTAIDIKAAQDARIRKEKELAAAKAKAEKEAAEAKAAADAAAAAALQEENQGSEESSDEN